MDKDTQSKDYDGKLSVGTYIGKEIYQTVVSFGSLIGGAFAGLFAGKAMFSKAAPVMEAEKWTQSLGGFTKIPGLGKPLAKMHGYTAGAGAFLGMMTGGLILGYGHWKKTKQAQMQIDEVSKDIAGIEVFKKTDPELKAENEKLWAQVNAREKHGASHAEKVRPEGEHANWRDHLHTPSSSEAQRA